jgi:putative transposase
VAGGRVDCVDRRAAPRSAMAEQQICLDKGYDFPDVHRFVELERYRVHIKHRRRGNPVVEACPVLGETQYPARRWVFERTLGWLTKRRSIRVH